MTFAMDGGVALQIGGATRQLRFTWGALAELRSTFGPEFQERVNQAMLDTDFTVLAQAISAGLGGAMTTEQVLEASPPIIPAVQALDAAFRVAYYGPTGKPDKADARPLSAARRMFAKLRAKSSKILLALGSKLGASGATSSL